MRTLADTIARLASLRRQQANQHGLDLAKRLSVLSEFGENPGGLASRFYLPEDHLRGSALVVVLHGCTQSANGYDYHSGWSQLADEEGFALLYPEQDRANNPNLCFNWFLPGDATRDSGEALSIRNMIGAMVSRYGIDRSRIFITGLSAGGAMAAVMLSTYPEVFAGGAIIAGLPYGVAKTVPEAFDRMRGHGGPNEAELRAILRRASAHDGAWPRISVWHGGADQTVASNNAEAVAAQWQGVHAVSRPPTYVHRDGGYTKRVWVNSSGDPVIEINTIAGMGHGTPLGSDGLGAPGPFMLNVGVSSTREIARFWGIVEATLRHVERATFQPDLASETSPARKTLPATAFQAETVASHAGPADPRRTLPPSPSGIRKTIEDALRTAGLMR